MHTTLSPGQISGNHGQQFRSRWTVPMHECSDVRVFPCLYVLMFGSSDECSDVRAFGCSDLVFRLLSFSTPRTRWKIFEKISITLLTEKYPTETNAGYMKAIRSNSEIETIFWWKICKECTGSQLLVLPNNLR